jgi:hypothetical protein
MGGRELWSRDHLEKTDLEVRNLWKQIVKKSVDWINLVRDRGVWWAAVNTVMNV